MLAELLVGFAAGVADFSVGAGYDILAVPLMILLGAGPQEAITAGLTAQLSSSLAYAAINHRTFATKEGLGAMVAAGLAALAFSTLSLTLPREVIEVALAGVLLLLATALCVRVAGGGVEAVDRAKGVRLAALGALAGSVKGLAGSGMSAVMMLGQLVMGAGFGEAVAIAVVTKSLPSALALAPRALAGGVGAEAVAALVAGSLLSIPIASKVREKVSARALSAVLCLYAVSAAAYILARVLASP